jgi:hypothetical protein
MSFAITPNPPPVASSSSFTLHAPAPIPPIPLPPPRSPSPVASGSALGPAFVPTLSIPPSLPIPTPFSRQTLDSAQLRAMYEPHPIQARSRGRPRVSYIYLLFELFINIAYN